MLRVPEALEEGTVTFCETVYKSNLAEVSGACGWCFAHPEAAHRSSLAGNGVSSACNIFLGF
jgi:hypothetical protein